MAVNNRVRVAGSGFTAFTFMNEPIVFAEQIGHQSQQPVAPATPIHPMDEPYPVQIITPAAAGPGTLVLQLTELYNSKVWERLGSKLGYNTGQQPGPWYSNTAANGGLAEGILKGAVDIVDVFIRLSQLDPDTINVTKYIRPPMLYGDRTKQVRPFIEVFRNCVISDIRDDEQVGVGTMQIVKTVTVMYTHTMNNSTGTLRSPEALRHRI
jgi:hypothetical protein